MSDLQLAVVSPAESLAESCCDTAAGSEHVCQHGADHQMTTIIDPSGNEVMVHTMAGIPTSMAVGGLVFLIIISHLLISKRGSTLKAAWSRRFNILGFGGVKKLVKKPWFPLSMQGVSIFALALVIYAGLCGSQRTNIAPVITWTIWWALLVFFVLGFGKLFCAVCPWEGVAALVTSLSFRSRKKVLGYERPWPKRFRNIYPALFLFILLTWFELGYGVTRSPKMTAIMAGVYLAVAVVFALVFERRAFCRYVCLVGRVQGIYALFSPVELRPESSDICRSCQTKDCYKGNETATGCPTGLFPGALNENSYCTLCTECVRACPHDNLAINARPPAADLMTKIRFRWDEAVMCIVLLALTVFHGLTMTPSWNRMTDLLRVNLDLGLKPVFSMLMVLMIAAPVVIFVVAAYVAQRSTRVKTVTTGKLFKAFAYSVIPVALFYHLAHNSMHFFMEAQNIIPLLSDPLGRGWDLFGTAGNQYAPMLSLTTIWWIQLVLIVVGHIYSVVVADRVAHHLFQDRRLAMRSLIPLIVTMVVYSGVSVWLISQPMEMRMGM